MLHNQPLGKDSLDTINDVGQKQIIETVKELLQLLNKDRSDNYYDWIHLGMTLRNIDISLLNDWIKFSKLSNKFKNLSVEDMTTSGAYLLSEKE